uniref:Uncharacterized protein n=1 Tax=Tanacetum cinerariifolium TaxID=118510 RepID=A0A699L5I4_TANCI|nr:hypothetical protein [Tanacetum cinerariifolium]
MVVSVIDSSDDSVSGLRILIILTKYTKWSRRFMDYIKLLEHVDERQVSDEFYGRTHILFRDLGKLASTLIDAEKPLLKDPNGEDVDVHTYRSMISSLMYLTSSRPDIMFAVCAYVWFQVTPKVSHLNAVKRIFRYLKGKPYLGLWYPKDSPFDLVAYSDSDYAVVATSSTEAEYVAAASGCAQVLWIQNQLLDYELLFEEYGHGNCCLKHLK